MASTGNFGRIIVNGYDITSDAQNLTHNHKHAANNGMPYNIGIKQAAPGIFDPSLSLDNGFRRHGQGAINAHNLFSPSSADNTTDIEFAIAELLGEDRTPAAGDIAMAFIGSLASYKPKNPRNGALGFDAKFEPRGQRVPPVLQILYMDTAIKTATNFNTTPIDDGAESVDTLLGGFYMLQVLSPTGVAATGVLSASGQPSDADSFTLVINSITYTYTFKTAITAAGHVLIGGSLTATLQNLWAAMVGTIADSGTKYYAGTTPIDTAQCYVGLPTTTSITITAWVTGTAANAWTLARSGANLAVSAANFAGGVAGDTYDVAFQAATSSGGSYGSLATLSGVGATRRAYYGEIDAGTTISRYLRNNILKASGAGTTQTWSGVMLFGRWYQ